MVNAEQVAGLVERFQKAQELVAAGAVSQISGVEGYFVVRNGDGTQHYLVRIEADNECCSRPDFQQRQKAAGQPCKHLLSSQLYAEQAAAKAAKPARKMSGAEARELLYGDAA